MKINKFEVECDLTIDEYGVLTGWFETPALPHVRYTIEIDAREIAELFEPLEIEEIEEVEQVLLPDESVADVIPEPVKTEQATGDASEDEKQNA